jgi:transcriptional regulator with XRE-family HTH domain
MKTNDRTQFGRAIYAERAQLGMTQDQLAQRAGLSAPGINRAENKRRRVEIDTLRALCTCWPVPASNIKVLIAHLHDEIARAGHCGDEYEIEHRNTPANYRSATHELQEIARARPDIAAHLYGLIDKLWLKFRDEDKRVTIAADPSADKPAAAPQTTHTPIKYISSRKRKTRAKPHE